MNTDQCSGHDRSADLAAYALGALEPGEATELQLHLRECAACREELAALEGVVDALPMVARQLAAPPQLRRRVLRSVKADSRRGTTGAGPIWPRLTKAPRVALAGALALAAVAIGLTSLGSHSPSGSRTIAAQVATAPATAQVRITGDHGQLIVRDMAPPPAGRIYEVWLKRRTGVPMPTQALFSVTSDGSADVDVPGDLRRVDEILVTQEPAGGSRVSTHAPLIVARLT